MFSRTMAAFISPSHLLSLHRPQQPTRDTCNGTRDHLYFVRRSSRQYSLSLNAQPNQQTERVFCITPEKIIGIIQQDESLSVNDTSNLLAISYEVHKSNPDGTKKLVGYITCLKFIDRIHVEGVKVDTSVVVEGSGKWLQLGSLLGLLAIMKAREMGITKVFGLAINDGKEQHARLTRYMRRFGAKDIRYVGDGLANLADRLTWGGVGMLMQIDANEVHDRFAPLIKRRLRI